MLRCLQCQGFNKLTTSNCQNCGEPLAISRASYYLEQADLAIKQRDLSVATAHLSAADLAIVVISPAQRQQYHLTATAFYLQGLIYYQRGDLVTAAIELEQARIGFDAQGPDQARLVEIHRLLGNVAFYQADFSTALTQYQIVAQLASSAGDFTAAGKAYSSAVMAHVGLDQVSAAVVAANTALEMAQTTGEPVSLAESYRILAWLHSSYGPYSRALECAAAALASANQQVSPELRLNVAADCGNVYLQAGELEQAERCLAGAEQLARSLSDRTSIVVVLVIMSELERLRGNHAGWLRYAEQGYREAQGSLLRKLEAALSLIRYHVNQKEVGRAHRYVQEISNLGGASSNDTGRHLIRQAEAMVYALRGDWEQAEAAYGELLENEQLSINEEANLHEEYGRLLLEAQPTAAARELQLAARCFERLGLPSRAAMLTGLLKQLNTHLPEALVRGG